MNTKQKFMKQFKFYMPLVLTALFIGCSSDDKLVDKVEAGTLRGAVLRTISNSPNSFLFDDPESVWTAVWEEQDIEDGALLASVDVYVNFVDTSPGNGTTTATETLVANIPASAFSNGPNGLPRTTFSLSYGDALAALGLAFDPAVVGPGDQFNIRTAVNLTDGRTISAADLSGTVSGGSFFSSPMNYRATVVCPPKAGPAGTWTIEMQDSYGDGWNGASLTVTLDGVATDYLVSAAQGFSNTETFDVPDGAESLSIIYNSGDWDSEVTFQITSSTGTLLIDQGPSPLVGTELLDYCNPF